MSFFTRIELAFRHPDPIFIDLEGVEKLTIEAVLLLVSRIQLRELRRCIGVRGNEPKDERLRALFAQSGFYRFVTGPPSGYQKEKDLGILRKHEGKQVREDLCAEMVHYATGKVLGVTKKNGGLYRTLIECMANTRDHAAVNNKGRESWWLSVYYDSDSRVASFAFLDNGVGVFKSVKMQTFLRQWGHFFGILSHVDILNELMEAKLGSRTGLSYRGKGLPSIRRVLQRQQIKNLRIVTNRAYLDVGSRTGKALRQSFRGTCLTWELHNE